MKLKTSLLITVATGTFLCASSVVSYAGTSIPDTMGLFRKKKKTESNDSIKSKNEYEKLTETVVLFGVVCLMYTKRRTIITLKYHRIYWEGICWL